MGSRHLKYNDACGRSYHIAFSQKPAKKQGVSFMCVCICNRGLWDWWIIYLWMLNISVISESNFVWKSEAPKSDGRLMDVFSLKKAVIPDVGHGQVLSPRVSSLTGIQWRIFLAVTSRDTDTALESSHVDEHERSTKPKSTLNLLDFVSCDTVQRRFARFANTFRRWKGSSDHPCLSCVLAVWQNQTNLMMDCFRNYWNEITITMAKTMPGPIVRGPCLQGLHLQMSLPISQCPVRWARTFLATSPKKLSRNHPWHPQEPYQPHLLNFATSAGKLVLQKRVLPNIYDFLEHWCSRARNRPHVLHTDT